VPNGAGGITLSDASSNTIGQSTVWSNPVSLHMTRADSNIVYVNGLFGDAGHAAVLDDSHGNSFYWNTLICRNGSAVILRNSDDNSAIGNVIHCPVRRDEAMALR
jgi:Periplasmic copper-binding protein (NosD)